MHAYVAWSLYHQCNIATVHAIEMVQRHAARYALTTTIGTQVLQMHALGWPTLESRHNILRTVMMYKIMNNLVRRCSYPLMQYCLHQLYN